jgi:PAS domain-containing protein
LVKAITAAAAVPTAILLANLAPRALELPSLSKWIHANAALEKEIRERRDIELDLRISEANYREQAELLDLTHDAIYVRSLEGKILFWNRVRGTSLRLGKRRSPRKDRPGPSPNQFSSAAG